METDSIKVDMLTNEKSTTFLGQIVTFQQQETTEIKNRIRAAWASFLQIQARVDLKIILSSAQASLIRHGDLPDDEPRPSNMDTLKRTRKNDSVEAAQDAPPHHPKKKKIQEEDTEK